MKTIRCLPIVAGILALCAGVPVFAQINQDTQRITVTASIPVLMNLTVDSTNVPFNFVQGDYDTVTGAGSKEAVNATTFKVASNARWKLNVKADNSKFSYVPTPPGTGTANKASGDLSVKTGTTAYAPVTSLTSLDLAQGEAGGYTAPGNSIPVSYQLNTSVVSDPPGTYTLNLTYTLMPQ